jgi:hypothetical protein
MDLTLLGMAVAHRCGRRWWGWSVSPLSSDHGGEPVATVQVTRAKEIGSVPAVWGSGKEGSMELTATTTIRKRPREVRPSAVVGGRQVPHVLPAVHDLERLLLHSPFNFVVAVLRGVLYSLRRRGIADRRSVVTRSFVEPSPPVPRQDAAAGRPDGRCSSRT